ncbi:MAG: malonate transporter subunit MadL [Arcicella sp.]|nr:malonate transporter subunit MadL [Arcicella sp.]
MKIYGVAILAACFLAGQTIGEFLGVWLSFDGNIGGVGFAMLFLIILGDWMKKKGFLNDESEQGIFYWSAMYIPVVIAMSSIQNVKVALSGGWVALLVGIIGTGLSLTLVPLLAKMGK